MDPSKLLKAIKKKPFINDDNFFCNWQFLLSFVAISIASLGVVISHLQDDREHLSISNIKFSHLTDGFSSFVISTDDIASSRSFYEEFLGLEPILPANLPPVFLPPFVTENERPLAVSYYKVGENLLRLETVHEDHVGDFHSPVFSMSIPRHNYNDGYRPQPKSEAATASKLSFLVRKVLKEKYVTMKKSNPHFADVSCKIHSLSRGWIDLGDDFVDQKTKEGKLVDPRKPAPSLFITRSLGWLVRGVDNVLSLVINLFTGNLFESPLVETERSSAIVDAGSLDVWCQGPSREWVGIRQESAGGETQRGRTYGQREKDARALALKVMGKTASELE
eukprot:GDKK01019397.1.p1 GENE.GDKK01019397.1~~GDKK01019397.1.p1  ORF type:complete len:356 (-),score=47.44 GDKK01019397.1:63-1067(-)